MLLGREGWLMSLETPLMILVMVDMVEMKREAHVMFKRMRLRRILMMTIRRMLRRT